MSRHTDGAGKPAQGGGAAETRDETRGRRRQEDRDKERARERVREGAREERAKGETTREAFESREVVERRGEDIKIIKDESKGRARERGREAGQR